MPLTQIVMMRRPSFQKLCLLPHFPLLLVSHYAFKDKLDWYKSANLFIYLIKKNIDNDSFKQRMLIKYSRKLSRLHVYCLDQCIKHNKPWDFTVLNPNRNNLSLCKFGTRVVSNGVSLKRKVLICSNISLAATLRATLPFMKMQEAPTLFPLY